MDGAVWRFRNEGNRAAFADHPEVYMPRFGGYDPVAIARGASVPGHPLFWAVTGERLYLFYSAEARATFLADPGRIIDAARRANGRRSRAASRADTQSHHATIDAALAGSPQAMKPGTRKFSARRPKRSGPPSGSVTVPPAAARMAQPAAISHSCVGASRG